ncbi:hypothetical protein BH10ACT2_BH10ACT2_19940 [soil metagenome]
MTELAEPFVIATERRAGDAPAWSPDPRPEGYVAYAPTRKSSPDRYFFALSIVHALRGISSAGVLLVAARSNSALSIMVVSVMLTAAHAALVVGCHLQRRWAKLGSIMLDVQASLMTMIVLIALSDFDLSASTLIRQVFGPALTIWLATQARVDRRRHR